MHILLRQLYNILLSFLSVPNSLSSGTNTIVNNVLYFCNFRDIQSTIMNHAVFLWINSLKRSKFHDLYLWYPHYKNWQIVCNKTKKRQETSFFQPQVWTFAHWLGTTVPLHKLKSSNAGYTHGKKSIERKTCHWLSTKQQSAIARDWPLSPIPWLFWYYTSWKHGMFSCRVYEHLTEEKRQTFSE